MQLELRLKVRWPFRIIVACIRCTLPPLYTPKYTAPCTHQFWTSFRVAEERREESGVASCSLSSSSYWGGGRCWEDKRIQKRDSAVCFAFHARKLIGMCKRKGRHWEMYIDFFPCFGVVSFWRRTRTRTSGRTRFYSRGMWRRRRRRSEREGARGKVRRSGNVYGRAW